MTSFQSARSVGSATRFKLVACYAMLFQSARSVGSATSEIVWPGHGSYEFQSARSVGSATGQRCCPISRIEVSIRALRGERDANKKIKRLKYKVSIRALRGERDGCDRAPIASSMTSFQSARSVGSATKHHVIGRSVSVGFNPRAPWGARPCTARERPRHRVVSIRALRGERDG